MALSCLAPIGIDSHAHRFAGLGSTALDQLSPMNKHVAGLLGVADPQLADLGSVMSRHVQQSAITDLAAHFRVTGGSIENNVELNAFLVRNNFLNHCLRPKQVVPEKCRTRCLVIYF